jgi:hypothetical protein
MNNMNMISSGTISRYSLVFLLLVSIAACKDDEDPAKKNEPGISEVTLNGGPYTNLTAKSITDEPAVATYSPTDDLTSVVYTAMANGKEFYVVLAFPGSGKGQHAWDEDNCFVQTWEDYDDINAAVTATYYDEDGEVHTGTVKIDNYGAVGGVITGSFEGDATFIDTSCNCMDSGTMKGTFSAVRLN